MTYRFDGEGELPTNQPPFKEITKPEAGESTNCDLSRKTWGTISTGDLAAVKPNCADDKGAIPHLAISDAQATARDLLVNPRATAEEKLRAVEALARSGVSQITLKDADGTERVCRLELEKSGKKTLVHMFAEDPSGKERVVLRGISNGDGTYSHERDRRGNEKSFNGDFWTANMQGKSSFLGVEGPEFPRPPRERPDDVRPPGDRTDINRPPFDIVSPVRPPNELWPFPSADDLLEDHTQMREYFNMLTSDSARVGGRLQRLSSGLVFRHGTATIDSDGWKQGNKRIDPCYQRHTSLRYPDGSSVDANEVPYMVLPLGKYARLGIRKGDIAIVERQGKLVPVVFADVGGESNKGEVSMAAARELGINPNPRTGGVQDFGTRYLIFPGSGDGTPQTPAQIRQKAFALLKAYADRQA